MTYLRTETGSLKNTAVGRDKEVSMQLVKCAC